MKELSIEEKAKAYDKAIERANELLYVSDKDSLQRKTVEHIFPELKDSEDEEIRRALIKSFNEYLKQSEEACGKDIKFKYVNVKEAIAWLEKQGKNNMGISEATKQKLEDNLNKALEKEAPESWNKFLKKQGEQNPAWSEEDEVMFRKAIITIDNVRMNTGSSEYYQGICNWLNSLKDRYTWKPSDEQMVAINTAINVLGKGTLNGKQLIELEEQLKKLKGK